MAGLASSRAIPGRRTTVWRRVWPVLLVLGLLAVVVYFAIGAVVFSRLTLVTRQPQGATPAAFNVPFEDVQVRSRDGLALAGWFMPRQGSDRALLLVHGKGSCRSCEFGGNFVEFASRMQGRGYNILMIDLRGHGQSAGERFTLGQYERLDVLGAVDWLQGRGFTRIGVLGVSMGAAGTVLAAADPAGGQGIKAMVLDSGFGELRELLEARFPSESGLPNFFLDGALVMGRVLAQTDMNSIRPVDDLPRIQAPLFLVFSAQDDLVPMRQMQAMANARPGIETWIVPDAGHARIYPEHRQEYVDRVGAFFDKALR